MIHIYIIYNVYIYICIGWGLWGNCHIKNCLTPSLPRTHGIAKTIAAGKALSCVVRSSSQNDRCCQNLESSWWATTRFPTALFQCSSHVNKHPISNSKHFSMGPIGFRKSTTSKDLAQLLQGFKSAMLPQKARPKVMQVKKISRSLKPWSSIGVWGMEELLTDLRDLQRLLRDPVFAAPKPCRWPLESTRFWVDSVGSWENGWCVVRHQPWKEVAKQDNTLTVTVLQFHISSCWCKCPKTKFKHSGCRLSVGVRMCQEWFQHSLMGFWHIPLYSAVFKMARPGQDVLPRHRSVFAEHGMSPAQLYFRYLRYHGHEVHPRWEMQPLATLHVSMQRLFETGNVWLYLMTVPNQTWHFGCFFWSWTTFRFESSSVLNLLYSNICEVSLLKSPGTLCVSCSFKT